MGYNHYQRSDWVHLCMQNANLDHCKVQARGGGEGGLGSGYDEVPTKEYKVSDQNIFVPLAIIL